MKRANHRLTLISAGILATLALTPGAFGQTGYLVTVDTTSVNGQTGNIDLQFDAGALTTQNACVTISNFLTDGTLGSPSTTTGSVTGTLATSLTINNGTGGCTTATTYTASTFNDYSQPITFGNTLSFFVTLNGPGVTAPAGNNNGNSGSSFGVDFTIGGSPALTGDPSNFAGTIVLNPDGTVTPTGLPAPGNNPTFVTIQAAELVTVTTSPSGLSFSVDSTSYTASQTFAWAIGSQHTLATTTPQGSSGTRQTFTQWSDGNTSTTDTPTISTGTTSYTAQFSTSYLLTTAVSPSSTDGSVTVNTASPTSDGYYPAGTPVSITATPNTGYNFSSWTGNVADANNASTTVTMSAPESVTANFVINNVNVTIGTSPSGLSFSVDGTPYSSAQVLTWQVGSNHTIATTSPQGTGTRYTFTGWSDGGAISHQVTATSGTTSYTASFSTSYLLTTAVAPSSVDGSVGANPASPTSDGYYTAGTPVTLTATANTGYNFSNWTGTTSSSTNPLVVTMNSPVSETANFVVNNVSVTIGTSPSGLLVSVDGGASQVAPVHVTWQVGTNHTIATSSPQGSSGTRYTFTGWSDSGAISHMVTASSATTSYTASFSTSYLLTTAASPSADGSVGANPLSPTSNGYYPAGTPVTLTATPASSTYKFVNWTGTTSSTSNPLVVTMNSPVSETANFALNTVSVTVASSPPSGPLFSVDGGAPQAGPVHLTWIIGSQHTLATTSPQTSPGISYQFTKWSDGGAISHMVTAPAISAVTYTVTFSVHYQLTTAVSPSGSGTAQPSANPYYAPGTVVNVSATGNPGYIFKNWTGPVANPNSPSTTVTMNGPESVTANFTEGPTLLTGAISGKKGPDTARQWTFLIVNTGPGAANNAQLNSLTLTQTSGKACSAKITTPIPVSLGNLAPLGHTSTTVTLDFANCASTAEFRVNGTLTANQGHASGIILLTNQTQ
ncbi:MAG TPA: hypothetical protein VMF91_04470 [Bryobacteraceae bacterium]|nr:hypothetical protein [Bryobacteraceae bacterium]